MCRSKEDVLPRSRYRITYPADKGRVEDSCAQTIYFLGEYGASRFGNSTDASKYIAARNQ